jgi:hypothetical protein
METKNVQSWECGSKNNSGNVIATLSGTTLTISGKGQMRSFDMTSLVVQRVVIQQGVTNISSWAFHNCLGLISVSIPESVTQIEGYAFENCTGLSWIRLPNSLTSIGNNAFRGCSGLRRIEFPDSVFAIGNYAFHGCNHLKSITISSKCLLKCPCLENL